MAGQRTARPLERLAEMAVNVAGAATADVLVCVSESGRAVRAINDRAADIRIVAATPSEQTYTALEADGFDVVKLPIRMSDRFKEARHALSVALRAEMVSAGDLVLCVIGQGLPDPRGDFMVLLDIDDKTSRVPLHDLVTLTDNIRPAVLDAVLEVACDVGCAARRGRRAGAIFVVGSTEQVLSGSRQLVLNPFHGYPDSKRMVTDPATREMLLELSKLDGAFVIRGDGFIETAGAFLPAGEEQVELPHGLGTRHATAAAVSARTSASVVTVSATDGGVRIFSGGVLVMHVDPDMSPESAGLAE